MMLSKEPKCFQIDKARDIPLNFVYEALDVGNPFDFALYYGAGSDSSMQIMAKSLVERKGEVKYVTDNDGLYTYCMSQSHMKDSDPPARLKMIVHYGYDIVHDQAASAKGYDVVNRNLQVLNDMIDLIMTEADYQKTRELDHHEDTLAMNSSAVWWPVCQILMLIGIGIGQMRHLKGYFSRITMSFNQK